ncbi:hypothetical protein GCM10011507_12180 [Edaphobacter acidisoli]|uniref:Uncharacterized protein n=1 Tax=Edaphobacter acidisoli TaxID=2040573 RepID=A0A916RLX4_9BACT|nr:hypothetical protein [Edaphobacter acidisoli]GGA62222.1 hypothetical protein GCM10011507_12180 [Edaphobacter acidisoli]
MADSKSYLIASLAIACLAVTAGCHSHLHHIQLSDAAIEAGRVDTPQASAKKIAGAGISVISACATQPYDNASKGIIVDEPGLHEDVLDLRDQKSFRAVPFGLSEARRLESLLEKETSLAGHPYPAEQIACIQQFASHLRDLTQPLVEADDEQKQLDVSAFDKASKEAEQETDEQTQQEEKAIHSAPSTNQ